MKIFLLIVAVVAGMVACSQTEFWQLHLAEQALEDAERSKPKIISRSDDGCAVYSFWADGDRRYFTRCGNDRTTTTRDYTVPCGKMRCGRTEIIEQVGEQ